MKKDVFVKMKNIQNSDDGRSEVELATRGTLSRKDGVYIITYEDSEATGWQGSTTDITVKDNSFANIIRNGQQFSNIVIENGKKHFCHYETPFGGCMVGIKTRAIRNNLTDDGGNLYMKYTVSVNTSLTTEDEILLDVTPRG